MYDVNQDSFLKPDPEMDKRLQRAINNTWQAIATDYLEMCEGNQCDREEMIEAVFDANHIETYGGDEEIAKYGIWLCRFQMIHFTLFLATYFPCKTYGL
jgi:hypothetical protein